VLAVVCRHGRSSPRAPLPRRHLRPRKVELTEVRRHGWSSSRAPLHRCRMHPRKVELASRHGYVGAGLGCSPRAKCSMKCLSLLWW
jgi:hypothetical protein